MIQGAYETINEYQNLLFELKTKNYKENIPEYGLIDPNGDLKFMFPFEDRFDNDKKYIVNVIKTFDRFCKRTNRNKVLKIETKNCEKGIEEIINLSYTKDQHIKWVIKPKTNEEGFSDDLRVIEFGLVNKRMGIETLSYSLEPYTVKFNDKRLTVNIDDALIGSQIGTFNLFSKETNKRKINKFETINKQGLKKKTKLKRVGDDYIFWITYNGNDSLIDHLCEISEKCILNDHHEAIEEFEKSRCINKMSLLKDDLIYLFEDYLIRHKTYLETQLLSNYCELNLIN